MGESRLKMNLLYTSSPVKGRSVQCGWCLQCVSTRDMLQFGYASGGLNLNCKSDQRKTRGLKLLGRSPPLPAAKASLKPSQLISDKNERQHRFPSVERHLGVVAYNSLNTPTGFS